MSFRYNLAQGHAVRHGLLTIVQRIIQALDVADARLKNTLDALRQTMVEPAFRPPSDEPKSLFDFVDEGGINDLYETIKLSIDRYDTARSIFKDISAAFDGDLELIHESLVAPQEEQEAERRMQSNGGSPIPALYASLETHAAETAQNLESLVKHYDLCVTALKHTEGGGEAITKAGESEQQERLEGLGLDLAQIEAEAAPLPISATERAEMLAVLQKDAAEVEDVVSEIKDRLAEMEEQLAQIMAYIQLLRGTAGRLKNALRHLKRVARNIHGYIAASADFQSAWSEEKAVLQEKMEEVDSMVELYSGFANAYDELILEAQRRKHVKHKMEKAIKETVKYLQQLYQGQHLFRLLLAYLCLASANFCISDDKEQRETFRSEHADTIPIDLWAGLLNPPPSYRFVIEDEEIAVLPDISREVFEAALKRVKARLRPSVRPDA